MNSRTYLVNRCVILKLLCDKPSIFLPLARIISLLEFVKYENFPVVEISEGRVAVKFCWGWSSGDLVLVCSFTVRMQGGANFPLDLVWEWVALICCKTAVLCGWHHLFGTIWLLCTACATCARMLPSTAFSWLEAWNGLFPRFAPSFAVYSRSPIHPRRQDGGRGHAHWMWAASGVERRRG